ncbi:MAG: hypothetical protein ACLR23_03820 [Clostridia bacterium]
MLKDPSYRKRWKEKEEAYRRAGIEEGRNLAGDAGRGGRRGGHV